MNYKEIFNQMLVFYEPNPKPTEGFYQKWLAEMGKYRVEDVKNGINVLENNKNRFPTIDECVAFVDSVAEHSRMRMKKAEEEKKPSRVEMDDDMRAWRDNYHDLINRKVTRGEYLKKAIEIGQMTPAEADKERNTYKNRGDKLDEYADVINKVM